MRVLTDHIAGSSKALRKCRRSDVKANGQVSKSVFMPRAEGQDRDGLSVSIQSNGFNDLHRQRFAVDGRQACSITVSVVRELNPLDVVPDPMEDDPTHSLIVGIPDRSLSVENLAAAEQFARQLAKRASPFTFPEETAAPTSAIV